MVFGVASSLVEAQIPTLREIFVETCVVIQMDDEDFWHNPNTRHQWALQYYIFINDNNNNQQRSVKALIRL